MLFQRIPIVQLENEKQCTYYFAHKYGNLKKENMSKVYICAQEMIAKSLYTDQMHIHA